MTPVTKEEATNALTNELITTVANIIVEDEIVSRALGKSKRFPSPGTWRGNLMDLPTPLGKPLGECAGEECRLLAEAHRLAAAKLDSLAAEAVS